MPKAENNDLPEEAFQPGASAIFMNFRGPKALKGRQKSTLRQLRGYFP